VWEDVELEMVVAERELAEALERLLERRGRVDSVQGERGHAAECHLDDHPECAKPDAGRAEDLGVALARALERGAVGEHQRQRFHLAGEVAQAGAGSVGGG
jgi:hypothetical protein